MQYPLFDRSGVDESPRPLAAKNAAAPPKRSSPADCEVLVCHAGTCRSRGAEAVLAEIEELVKAVGDVCTVRQSGCLGYCSEAPNAVVRERGRSPTVHRGLRSMEASAKVVERATGKKPKLDDAGARLDELRVARVRQHATEASHWNAALHGLAQQAAQRPALRAELQALLGKAGFPEGVGATMPSAIANYSPWSLQGVTPVSKHSALFRFVSADRKRGTPHPRGSGRVAQPITWHTTLLAEVGPNDEGPCPWIERDYTPVSTAKEWEAGRCDLLVKVYPRGAATAWLAREAPERVWLSKPAKTLRVPDLVADGRAPRPASVLLLLAGTGVVALPQILQHRDPMKLGISTPRRDQLRVPIDLVLSCRVDDALLLPHIAQWCRDGGEASGVRHCTLLLTPANAHEPPFPDAPGGDAAEAESALQGLTNARILRTQLSSTILIEATARMPQPCRVVVSGPGSFNTAARRMLAELVDDEDDVTILPA